MSYAMSYEELDRAYQRLWRDHQDLLRQVNALQRRGSELLAARRGIRYLVHEFHDAMGIPVAALPKIPDDDAVRLRLALIAEVFLELFDAALTDVDGGRVVGAHLFKRLTGGEVRVDLPAFVDALADLDYVVEGTRLTFGVDGWPVLCEVHRANMEKERADDPMDKPRKGPTWRAPDVLKVLRDQGWTG